MTEKRSEDANPVTAYQDLHSGTLIDSALYGSTC